MYGIPTLLCFAIHFFGSHFCLSYIPSALLSVSCKLSVCVYICVPWLFACNPIFPFPFAKHEPCLSIGPFQYAYRFNVAWFFPHPCLWIFFFFFLLFICLFALLFCSPSIIAIYSLPIKADEHERKQLIYAYIQKSISDCLHLAVAISVIFALFGFCLRLLSAVLFASSPFVFLFSVCTLRFPFDFCCAKQMQIKIIYLWQIRCNPKSNWYHSTLIRTLFSLFRQFALFFLLIWFRSVLRNSTPVRN